MIPPLGVGDCSNDANLAGDLGKVYRVGANHYRLVKAAADIATAAKKVLVTATSSGVPTWSVNTSTTANDYTVVGVVPSTITGRVTSTTITSGDYFLIQCSGNCKIISAAAMLSAATPANAFENLTSTLLDNVAW